MTMWSMDYAFLTQDDAMIRDAGARLLDPGHIKATILVCQDSYSGGVRAHVVKCKGTGDEWIVERTIKDIEEFGYGGCAVKLKCDQEPAIMDLQKSICNKRAAKTVPVNSPVGDSQSNGRVENAIRRVQAGIRSVKHATEAEIKTVVSTGHTLFPWLVEWAADLLTRYSVNGSGRTPVQEIRGSKSMRPIAKFGEKILYHANEAHDQTSDKIGRQIQRRSIPRNETEIRWDWCRNQGRSNTCEIHKAKDC